MGFFCHGFYDVFLREYFALSHMLMGLCMRWRYTRQSNSMMNYMITDTIFSKFCTPFSIFFSSISLRNNENFSFFNSTFHIHIKKARKKSFNDVDGTKNITLSLFSTVICWFSICTQSHHVRIEFLCNFLSHFCTA